MATHEKRISVTEFKATCLKLLEQLPPAGLVVTKRGTPIARVLPYTTHQNQDLIGCMRGKIRILGDILSTGARWDVES